MQLKIKLHNIIQPLLIASVFHSEKSCPWTLNWTKKFKATRKNQPTHKSCAISQSLLLYKNDTSKNKQHLPWVAQWHTNFLDSKGSEDEICDERLTSLKWRRSRFGSRGTTWSDSFCWRRRGCYTYTWWLDSRNFQLTFLSFHDWNTTSTFRTSLFFITHFQALSSHNLILKISTNF